MSIKKWVIVLVFALPGLALAQPRPYADPTLTRAELTSVLRDFHPAHADFDSASGADRCLDRVSTRMVELARQSLSRRGYIVDNIAAPTADIFYTEKFHDYGAHVYGTLHYGLTLRDAQGTRVRSHLSFVFDTTTQISTSYRFVRQGQAVATDLRRVWVSPGNVPKLDGQAFLDISHDSFVNAQSCELTGPALERIVGTYPCGTDPAESCPDGE